MKLQWKKFNPVYVDGTPCTEDDYLGEIDLEKSLPIPCAVKVGHPEWSKEFIDIKHRNDVEVLFVGNVNRSLGLYGCGTYGADEILEIALIEVEA